MELRGCGELEYQIAHSVIKESILGGLAKESLFNFLHSVDAGWQAVHLLMIEAAMRSRVTLYQRQHSACNLPSLGLSAPGAAISESFLAIVPDTFQLQHTATMYVVGALFCVATAFKWLRFV